MLTEEFIKAIDDPEKQEICNQLNRRTEFIVLRTTYGLFDADEQPKAEPAAKPATKAAQSADDDFLF